MKEFGEGPLSQFAAFVYTLLVVELLLLVSGAPAVVLLMLLGRDASNIPLAVVCALPLGPAISAALYALRHRRGDLTDLTPAAAYLRGYRLNLLGVLKIWVPWLVWLSVVAVNLANFGAAGVPPWWAGLLVVVVVASALWEANALMITSLFEFRTRDVARLATYFLVRTPGTTLGNACLLVVAAGVLVVSSEAVLALLGVVFVLAYLWNSRPIVAAVRQEFTA
ncbi:MAG TPA: hypothetical protein VFC00_32265 [Micromonosporaceae bacterium]|nr:hypothetical protein [Micromonosporaceae bacterium]